ncbi:hypothetical protein F5878DRAFT_647071 [Lentinula raphanica]|uniref:C2H2-type domain-containing protein n=1 Tax=Lentinula raphanica TaxID=153919 RepID=A0AA38NWU3_9AGAR|nr:hypothetical protein F5878DRAFT_647071 [Lentinula raphanica]
MNSSTSASSSSTGLIDGQSPGWDLGSQTIEEIMEDLYATANAMDVQPLGIPPTRSDDKIFKLLNDPHPWSFNQQQFRYPKIIFSVSVVNGQEVLHPMVPIRKSDYFNKEAFEKAQRERFVSDSTVEILWNKRYSPELTRRPELVPGLGHDEAAIFESIFDANSFDQAQHQKPANAYVSQNEEFGFQNRMNGYLRTDEQLQNDASYGLRSSENQWREVILNYSSLPSALFPDNQLNGYHSSDGLRMCFVDSEGGRHYTNIVLSDQYMLVALPSESASDHFLWDSYGTHILRQPPGGALFGPSIVSPEPSSVVSSPRKRGEHPSSKKLCSAKKHAAASNLRHRLIGPTTRGNPQSERAPQTHNSLNLDFPPTPFEPSGPSLSLDTPDSPAPSSPPVVPEMKCWCDGCPRTFTILKDLEAHHILCHPGLGGQGEMKRHVKSVQHLGGAALQCPNQCSKRTFSRHDALSSTIIWDATIKWDK